MVKTTLIMKNLLYSISFFCVASVAFAQENRISTNKIDTLPTRAPAERLLVPAAGAKIEAVKMRSTSEIDAEMRSKAKTESLANSKPNPYDKPLTEPTPAKTAGSGTTNTVRTPAK